MESWPFFILALRVPREGTAAFADDDSETVPGLYLHQSYPAARSAPLLWLQGALCEHLKANGPMKP